MPPATPKAKPSGIRKVVDSCWSSQPPAMPGRIIRSTTANVRESHCVACSQIK